MDFEVTDNTGRAAYVSFYEATGILERIVTHHNDIMPGFNIRSVDREAPVSVGIYTAEGESTAMVILQENTKFALQGSEYISLMPTGKYKIENGKLILSMDVGEVIFMIERNSLIFESGTWLENWVEKGTGFYLRNPDGALG
jgi:hypothetical protein